MEVDFHMGSAAPNYIPTLEFNNQSKRDPKGYNLSITSTSEELTTAQFISLQLELLTMISNINSSDIFQVISDINSSGEMDT